jgi:hypothetical protein
MLASRTNSKLIVRVITTVYMTSFYIALAIFSGVNFMKPALKCKNTITVSRIMLIYATTMLVLLTLGNVCALIVAYLERNMSTEGIQIVTNLRKHQVRLNWKNAFMCLHVFIFIPWFVEQIKLYMHGDISGSRDCSTFVIVSTLLFVFVLALVLVEIIVFFVYLIYTKKKELCDTGENEF